MDTPRVFFLLVLSLLGCANPRPASSGACPAALDPGDAFSRHEIDGTFVLRDETSGCTTATDPALADTAFSPKSTFKIPNTLIGLETGVIAGEHHAWKWDGRPQRIKDWEQDLDLGGALKASCLPCYQDVARRVGEAHMREFLRAFRYGNEDLAGPIDGFWLDGPLRITPRAQTEFLHRMLSGELPVKKENVDLTWRLLEIERGPDFTWRGKTGLGAQDGRAIGWLVGYLDRAGHRWTYATLVRGKAGADVDAETARLMPLRKPLTRALLVKALALPP